MPVILKLNNILILILLATSLMSPQLKAEYRVFQLEVENTETGDVRTVETTLDHLQYIRYHPIRSNEAIRYVTSWMCYENTNGFRPHCQKVETDP